MKALVVEDEGLARSFLQKALEDAFSFQEVVAAKDGREAWEICKNDESFQFFIIDLVLPGLDGIKLGRKIIEERKGASARILAVSSECDDFTVKEAVRAGVLGCIDKPGLTEDVLFEAVETVLEGKVYYSVAVRAVMRRLAEDPEAYFKVLSDRELEVLRLIAQGMDQDQVGEALGVSPFTARRHRLNISAKLNRKNESQLIHYALEKGIVKHKSGLDWT